MPPLVFVSHSNKDSATAGALVEFIEAHGIACWWSTRDIHPGTNWAEALDAAIDHCDLMLFVLSSHSNRDKDQVLRELEQANNRKIPILTYRIEDLDPSHGLRFFVRAAQFCDAFDRTPLAVGVELLDSIKNLTTRDRRPFWQPSLELKAPPSGPPIGTKNRMPVWRKKLVHSLRLGVVATGCSVLVVVAVAIFVHRPANSHVPPTQNLITTSPSGPTLPATTPAAKDPPAATALPKVTSPADSANIRAAELDSQNAEAMFQTALRELNQQEFDKSLRGSRRAAEMGHVDAMCLLAEHYLNALGVAQDIEEAKRWYTKAANAGSNKARHNLEILEGLTTGKTEPPDHDSPEEAALMRKAKGGDAESQYRVACGFVERGDLDGAKVWIERAAHNKWPRAMSELGTMYFAGVGVEKDNTKALEWWSQAASAGCEVGRHNLEVFRQRAGE